MTNPPGEFGEWPEPQQPHPGAATRPSPLNLAVKLMYLGAIVTFLGVLPALLMGDEFREVIREQLIATGEQVTDEILAAATAVAIAFIFAVGLLGAGLWILMAVFNGKGRKWARVTATVLGVIGILINLTTFTGVGQPNVGFGPMLGLLNAILAAVILVLLWRPDNAPYYEANSRR